MAVDYKKICEEYFGTSDLDELKAIADTVKKKNPRGAGRKRVVTDEQIAKMHEMQSKNVPQSRIAEQLGVSRQTVMHYLSKGLSDDYTLQIDFMYRTSVCTSIYVNFKDKRIRIINKTDDILHRAFGVKENPDWDDFMYFLKDRCFPESRGDKRMLLDLMGIDSYDPLQIVEKTGGRTYEDRQWMKFKYRRAYGTH